MPGVFRLYIPKYERWYDAETRWHQGGFVGIEFVTPGARKAQPSESPDGKVARLEAEVVKLRKLFEEIRADPSRARQLLEHYE